MPCAAAGDLLGERGLRAGAALDDLDRLEQRPHRRELDDIARARLVVLEPDRRGAVGHHGLDVGTASGDVDRDVGAGREPERGDAPRLDVVAFRQEVERRGGVLLPAPAVRVDRALAVAAAARVVEEHAVAVADEHLGVAQRAAAVSAASGDHQHRRAVRGRAVPALEAHAVGCCEGDGLVGGRRRVAHRPLQRMDVDDRHAHRHVEDRHGDDGGGHQGHADRPAPSRRRGALAAMAERDPGGEADEDHARDHRDDAGDVVRRRAVEDDVVQVPAAVDERQHAERERDRRAHTGAEPWERDDRGDRRGERDRGGERMLRERHAGARQQERVVERVRQGEDGGDAERDGLCGAGAKSHHLPPACRPGAGAGIGQAGIGDGSAHPALRCGCP